MPAVTVPRIPPAEPPYTPEHAAMLARWMPPGAAVEPLRLFRTLLVHDELASRMRPLGAGILGRGRVAPREREIMILRTCALAGAEYEWGVHATAFGATVGLTPEQIAATARSDSEDAGWSARDALVLRLADELHANAAVSDELWSACAHEWADDQLFELVVIAGWYRLLSYVINGTQVELESWAARFPAG